MAYLNNTEITVDAILTKKGREKLASGEGLNITKFALGDDEVDYTFTNQHTQRVVLIMIRQSKQYRLLKHHQMKHRY